MAPTVSQNKPGGLSNRAKIPVCTLDWDQVPMGMLICMLGCVW